MPPISDRRRIQFALAIALATFCALLLAAIVARNHVSGLPVFGIVSDVRLRAAADRLPVDDIVAIKATHGIRAPAYEVALFGNSRAVMVGHRHIGLDEGRFFNFAVGGTSFQQSVVMLERLVMAGKAPRTALISLDNLDMNFYGGVSWPFVLGDPGRAIRDARDIWNLGFRNPLRIAIEPARLTLNQTISFMNAKRMGAYLTLLGGGELATGILYATDGARTPGPASPLSQIDMLVHPMPNAYHQYHLRSYMNRLGGLRQAGTRIVVYESPVHPSLIPEVEKNRRPDTASFRRELAALCERAGVACLPAPELVTDDPWPDCCHAPADALGSFLRRLL